MGNSVSGEGAVQSVDRALSILDILGRLGEAGVTEIATELAVHKSTASRLLAALAARDLVEQQADRGRYRLGLGLVRLAGKVTSNLDTVSRSRDITRELAAATGETVNIAVLQNNQVLYVDQVAGSGVVSVRSWVGAIRPTHCSSTGKALTAWLSPELRKAARPKNWEVLAPKTITSASELEKELAKVREQGFAVARQEMEEELVGVAAPIRDTHGEVVAALSVSGPYYRMTPEKVASIAPLVVAAAQSLGDGLLDLPNIGH
jgi:DNA-binding IclR family transcriptional regulator